MEPSEKTAYVSMAATLRIHVIEATNACNSGHATSCASISEFITMLFFHPEGMKYHSTDPQNLENDKLILSKGHAAPILYSAWAKAGLFCKHEVKKLRKIDSDLEGHPTPRLNFIDIATGSLGQGLSAACGMAYSMKYFEKRPNRVFVIMGDGECAEGSVWEAANFAQFYNLNNIIAFVDVNSLGQASETMLGYDVNLYRKRFEAFGWNAVCIDGHNFDEILQALKEGRNSDKPFVIVARTVKGKDMIVAENKHGWHGKPLGKDAEEVMTFLYSQVVPDLVYPENLPPPSGVPVRPEPYPILLEPPQKFSPAATRMALGTALASLSNIEEIVALDCDTRNSTGSELFYKACPERFIECYIAEQNMVGVTLGVSKRGKIPFACIFGVFMTRCYDQIRLSNISNGNIKLVGSHAGVSIGEDGPTHMALEDLALFRSLPGSTVLYPSDMLSAYKAVEVAANIKGLVYIKTSRPTLPNIHNDWDAFEEDLNVVVSSDRDVITVLGAGVTVHEAIKAAESMKKVGIMVRVVDLFCVKPFNRLKLLRNLREAGNILITVEDHYLPGGIFETVASELAHDGIKIYGLWVTDLPRSGKSEELLALYNIDAEGIKNKIKEALGLF
jgi:transketolase